MLQLFPMLQVGFLVTYVGPLVFVITITIIKEAHDDLQRYRRDSEANSQKYTKVALDERSGEEKRVQIKSDKIKVGDIIEVGKNVRVPADMVLLKTDDESGAIFIRTD